MNLGQGSKKKKPLPNVLYNTVVPLSSFYISGQGDGIGCKQIVLYPLSSVNTYPMLEHFNVYKNKYIYLFVCFSFGATHRGVQVLLLPLHSGIILGGREGIKGLCV